MSGSSVRPTAPRPLELAWRLTAAALLVLVALQLIGIRLVEPLLPMFRGVISVLDDDFLIYDASLSTRGALAVVSFTANLKAPKTVQGGTVYPLGWRDRPEGLYRVSVSARSVSQYGAVLLIAALAWPVRRPREAAMRLSVTVGLIALLLAVAVPVTVVAELHSSVDKELAPHAVDGWMVFSRFLMGGGGIAAALVMAVAAIRVGRLAA